MKKMIDNTPKISDLHSHTTASDGVLDLNELVDMAKKNKLHALAITDHDTVEACRYINNIDDIEIIPGVEMSVNYNPIMHIIGLYVDVDNSKLNNVLNNTRRVRKELLVESFRLLRANNIQFNIYDMMKKRKILSVESLCKYLVSEQLVVSEKQVDEIFNEIWDRWRNSLPTIKESINCIHEAGGFAILAHPILLNLSEESLIVLLKDMKEYGIDGIEVYHKSQPNDYRRKLCEIADDLDLFKSGGSDFHGKVSNDNLASHGSNTYVLYEDVLKLNKRRA